MKRTTVVLTGLAALALSLCCACTPGQEPAPATGSPEPSAPAGPKLESQYYQDGALALPEVTPAPSPEVCGGFAALAWGESYDTLFQEGIAQFAVQQGATYEGFMGTAYYSFRDGGLYRGQLAFYALPDKSDLDIYIELRAALTERYGEPLAQSEAAELSTLEDVMAAGEGTCAEMWSAPTDQGGWVQITLTFAAGAAQTGEEGGTSLSFTAA